jgi:hypothetical protein
MKVIGTTIRQRGKVLSGIQTVISTEEISARTCQMGLENILVITAGNIKVSSRTIYLMARAKKKFRMEPNILANIERVRSMGREVKGGQMVICIKETG